MVRVRLFALLSVTALALVGCTTGGFAVPSPRGVGTTGATPTSASAKGAAAGDDPRLDTCDPLALLPCARQVAHLSLPIAGTTITLTYSSDRQPGRTQDPAPTAHGVGLGGWTLSVVDGFDQATGKLVTGTGAVRAVTGVRSGDQTLVSDLAGARVDVFDPVGRLTAVMDATTGATVEKFDWSDQGLTSVSDTSGVALTVVRSADGTPTRLVATNGASTFLTATGGTLTGVGYPDGSKATLSSSGGGLINELQDQNGVTTDYSYDSTGRLISLTDGSGTRTSYSRQLKDGALTVSTALPAGGEVFDATTADAAGTTWSHTDAAGVTQSVRSAGSRITLTEPDGTRSTITVAPHPKWGMDAPQPAKIINGSTTFAGLSTATTQSWTVDGQVWHFAYDPATRTSTRTDPTGATSSSTFDTAGRMQTTKSPTGPTVSYQYGPQSRIASITVGTGPDARTWKYSYSGHTVTTTDPVGGVQQQSLTETGALTGISGPGGSGLAITRDSTDRVTGFAAPAGGQYAVTWGANGQVAATNAPAGQGFPQFTGFDYDKSGNLIKQFTASTSLDITRDAAGRIQAYNAGAGPFALTYDKAGRITTLTSGTTAVSETYVGSALTGESVDGPVKTQMSRAVDGLGRTTALNLQGGQNVSVGYDAAGRIVKTGDLTIVRDPTGLQRSRALGTLTAPDSYNQFGELIGEKVTRTAGTVVATILDRRDNLGRLIAVATTVGATTSTHAYTYDDAGGVVSETIDGSKTSYTYDGAGNLTSAADPGGVRTTYSYDGRNALIRSGDTTYTYDGAGQLATATSTSGTTTYVYDAAGRLQSVTRPGTPTIYYTVDGFGRRVATAVGGKITGGLAYVDNLRPAAELDPSGKVLRQFVYSDPSTIPAYLRAGGTDFLEIADGTGSPVLALNASTGAVADQVVRTARGQVMSESAPMFQVIGFAGGITDPHTDLVRFGARDYDTATGRWTAPDPLSIGGGSANLYEYVNGDPVNQSDPAGLCNYRSIGVSAGAGLGGYIGVSGGIARTGGQIGLYGSVGVGVGLGVGVGGVVNCLNLDDPPETPAGLGQFGGAGRSAEGTFGPVTVGGDEGEDANGNPISHGGHVAVGAGAESGGSATRTHTGTICVFGCNPPPESECSGAGCNTDPSDPTPGSASGDTVVNNAKRKAASLFGEPHLKTVDQAYYDLMAVGEFTWMSSDTGALEVQARTQPLPHRRDVSITTAVAMKIDGDQLMVSRPGGYPHPLVVSLAGNAPPATGAFPLPHLARVVLSDSTLTVTAANGIELKVQVNPVGLDITALLPESLIGHISGLAGPFTGSFTGTVRTRGGVTLKTEQLKDYNALYRTFGDSWRITQATSLFTDNPGRDATQFDDPTFPDRSATTMPAGTTTSAQAICGQLDLVAQALAACVLDVAVTGDAGFASSAARATDTAPGTTVAIGSADLVTPGQTVSGNVTAGGKNSYAFTVEAGDVAYFAAAAGCTAPTTGGILWHVENFGGTSIDGATSICDDQGRVAFTRPGSYRLVVASSGGGSGRYAVTWKTSRPDVIRPLTSGSTGSATIELPGAQDVYTLAVTAGTVGYFAAAPTCRSTLDAIQWYLQDSQGGTVTGASSICDDQGRVVFAKSGTYRIIVASFHGGTGAYSLTWNTSRPDASAPLTAGATASGTIDRPGAQDVYTISVTAGTVGYFAAAADCTDPAAGPLTWSVVGPDGVNILGPRDVCDDQGRVLFPTTGTYQLRVAGSLGSTGRYSMTWKRSRPDRTQTLAVGSSASGTIDLPGAHDVWSFTASTAGKITLRAPAGCKSAGLRWQILRADGVSESARQDVCSDFVSVPIDAPGAYQVVVSSDTQAVGTYSFTSTEG